MSFSARAFAVLCMAGLSACSSGDTSRATASVAVANRDFLQRCWGAVETQRGGSEFELSFEAIMIPGMEGGTYARSRACPDARLNLAVIPPEDDPRWDRMADSVQMPMLGTGLRGRMRVAPMERSAPQFLRVRVLSFRQLEQMSPSETQAFIDEFDIG